MVLHQARGSIRRLCSSSNNSSLTLSRRCTYSQARLFGSATALKQKEPEKETAEGASLNIKTRRPSRGDEKNKYGQRRRDKLKGAKKDTLPYRMRFNDLRRIRFEERLRTWAGTVAVTDPSTITDEELIRKLPDREVDFSVTTVVLLFTPELARFHNEEFIQKILSHLCRAYLQKPSIQDLIRVVTGIVDKVPASAGNSYPRSPVAEGVSVILSNSFMDQFLQYTDGETGEPRRRRQQQQQQHQQQQEQEQPSVLRISSVVGSLKYQSDDQVKLSGKHELQLALANTLFVNGRHSTLAESFWRRERPGSCQPLELAQGFRYLKNFTVRAQLPPYAMFGAVIPLKPLTEPRVIRTGMGNIIKEIEVDDQVVPAASELESAVNAYVKAQGDRVAIGGKVMIYALVRDIGTNPIVHTASADTTSNKLKKWLETGARLLRVTGGGGGWGPKKGLLSLEPSTGLGVSDPDISNKEKKKKTKKKNNSSSSSSKKNSHAETADVDELPTLPPSVMGECPNLVQPGATVQFFICVSGLGLVPTRNRNESSYMRGKVAEYKTKFTHTLVAGMIPQAESAVPHHSASDGTSSEEQTRLIQNTFGAMSEQGLALVIKEIGQPVTAQARRRADHLLSSTRIDVPHIRFEYRVAPNQWMASGRSLQEKTVDDKPQKAQKAQKAEQPR